ncbi:MAG: hypothetical protein J0I12_24960 [Candidatus Eremiobacteraeota bacterium]|nr:hypothetical protein [Candidatus Eremiobacteraeota bacterium]
MGTTTTTSSKRTTKKAASSPLDDLRAEALELEAQLEEELWKDAIRAAQAAVESLAENESSGHPFDRRRGLRLRDKATKIDAAFNRLRALRRGEMLPPRVEDEF